MPEIECQEIRLIRGDKTILGPLSCRFGESGVCALMGFSGSGKSSLLKLAAGLLPPSGGSLLVDGMDYMHFRSAQETAFRRESGFIFQDGALWANRSILQNLLLPLEVHRPDLNSKQREELALEMLEKTGYRDKPTRRPSQISAGERKSAAAARALVTSPRLLFADSPLLNLDSYSQTRILDLLKSYKLQGASLIIASSSAKLLSRLADRLVIVHEGVIIEDGPFAQVRGSTNPISRQVLDSVLEESATYDDSILDLLGEQ